MSGRAGPGARRRRPWLRAAAVGGAAFGAVAGAGQLIAVTARAGGGPGSPEVTAKLGWLYVCAFHHVPIEVVAARPGTAPGPAVASGAVATTLGVGTAIACAALFAAGRAAADAAGGDDRSRVLAGLRPACIYAPASLAASALASVTIHVPLNPFVGNVTIRPSPLGSLLWPLAFAVVAGAAGGRSSARRAGRAGRDGARAESPASIARARGVAAAAGRGGVAMLLAALTLSIAGVVVLAVLEPDATSAYVRAVTAGGPGRAAALVGHQVLALPNEAAFVLVPAMGGCDGAYGRGVDIDLVCLDRLPQTLGVELFTPESGPPPSVERAPATLLLLLAVPAAATVVGGVVASRHAGASWRVAAAAAAGVVFAALVGIIAFLAGIRASGELLNGAATGTVTYGPRPLVAAALALAWGIPGGVAGAVLDRRR